MDKDTFCRSGELVYGVAEDVNSYLFQSCNDDILDKEDILDDCDSAIHEIESWKKAIMEVSK